MKKIVIGILALMLGVLPVMASQHFTFNNPFSNADIRVTFPAGAFTDTPDSGTSSGYGNLKYSGDIYGVNTTDDAYLAVAVLNYSGTLDTSLVQLNEMLDGAVAGEQAVEVPNARENATLSGLFARETAATSGDYDSYIVVAVNGDRAYMSVLIANKNLHTTQADADEFFRSIGRNN